MVNCIKSACVLLPQRWVTALLCSGCLAVCYVYRQTFLQTFRNIVYDSTVRFRYHGNISDCPYMASDEDGGPDDTQRVYYYWNPEVVRAVRQAYQIGFMVIVVPGGMVADLCGPRATVLLALAVITCVSLLSPLVLSLEPSLVLISNLAEGISHGLLWPSLAVLSASWAPSCQRARFCSAVVAGIFFGWSLGFFMEDLIFNYITGNWQFSFYVVSCISFFWLVVSATTLFSSAGTSPYILPEEASYIKDNLEGFQLKSYRAKVRWRIPFKAMLTSPAVISLILIDWAVTWVHQVTFGHMDMYLFHIEHMTDHMSRMIKVAIEFVVGPSCIFWGIISDYLVNSSYISRTNNRIIFSAAANTVVVICLLCLSFMGCDPGKVIVTYTALCYFRGPHFLVLLTNAVDLSPQHAGVLLSLVKFVGSTAAICSWELMWFFCREYCDAAKWKTVFMVSALVLVVLSLPYLKFGSAEVQWWNYFSELPVPESQEPPPNTLLPPSDR